jgi:hypothetical protein
MGHEVQDEISLELGRRVAARLREHPELVHVAHTNLARWLRRNADAPALVRCYREWEDILQRPISEISELLEAETDEAQRLRQNSPFAGRLPPSEVWAIKADTRQRHAKSAA